MVPLEAFSIEAPQSSIAFCSGCDGGTQCDSFSSKVLSCAAATPVPRAKIAPSANARMVMNDPPLTVAWRAVAWLLVRTAKL